MTFPELMAFLAAVWCCGFLAGKWHERRQWKRRDWAMSHIRRFEAERDMVNESFERGIEFGRTHPLPAEVFQIRPQPESDELP